MGFSERRGDERLPADQPVSVTLLATPPVRFDGRLLNWSGNGACVEITGCMPLGSLVKIEWEDTMLLGEAVHAQPVENGVRIGLRLEHALYHTRDLAELNRRLLGEAAEPVRR